MRCVPHHIGIVVVGVLSVVFASAGWSHGTGSSAGAAASTAPDSARGRTVSANRPASGQSRAAGTPIVRELPALRTADSDTFLRVDGSRVVKIHAQPINYLSGSDSWLPIDDRLVPHGGGQWGPIASGTPFSFPAVLGRGSVLIGSGPDRLAISLLGVRPREGRSVAQRRIYSDMLPGVSLSFSALTDGVRELVSLAGPSAPSTYRYGLGYGSGLHASLTQAGGVVFRDGMGRLVYTLAPPTVSDASMAGRAPLSGTVHYELSHAGTVLSVVLDSRWLHDPHRSFPVTLDPDVSFADEGDCTIKSERGANKSLCGGSLSVGVDSEKPKDVNRALLRFNLSSIPANSAILQSRLALYTESTAESSVEIEAYGLTRGFTIGATWKTYNGSLSWTTQGGDYASLLDGKAMVVKGEVGKWIDWGLSPEVEQWVQNPSSNYGVLLKSSKETTSGIDKFAQAGGKKEVEPYLEVIYEARMGTPLGQTIVTTLAEEQNALNVNVDNGNLNVVAPDLQYQGKGYETTLGRSYDTEEDGRVGTSFGPDWRQNMGSDTLLAETSWDGSRFFHQADGSYIRFDRAPSADSSGNLAFTGEAEVPATFVARKDGTSALTYNNTGVEWQFDAYGYPQKIVDPGGEGNTISLSYTESLLTTMSDTHGHSLLLTRSPSTGSVTQIKDAEGHKWEYGYTGGLLTSYSAAGHETKYGYYENETLKDIVYPFETYVFAYDGDERLTSIRRVVNGTIEKVGSSDEITSFTYNEGSTVVKNPEGAEQTYYFEPSGKLKEEPETQEAASAFYANSTGIQSKAAGADVTLQDRAAPLDSQLYEQLKSKYVGEWFNTTSSQVEIGIAKGAPEEEVRQDLQKLGLEGQAKIVSESADWGQLTEAQASLDSSLKSLEESGLIATGAEPSADAVSVQEANTLTSVEKAKVVSETAKAGAPTVINEEEVPTLYGETTSCEHGVCSPPLRGGVSIQHNEFNKEGELEGITHCTAGFIAKSIYTGLPFVLTAGHCIWDTGLGSEWTSSEPADREKEEGHEYYRYGNRQIGPGSSYVFGEHHSNEVTSEGDAGAIFARGGSWVGNYLPAIVNWGHNTLYPIINTSYNPSARIQNFVVCTSGTPVLKPEKELKLYNPHFESYPVPKAHCGILGTSNKTLPYAGGLIVKGIMEFYVCNKETQEGLLDGDSGSPVFMDGHAYGLISGRGLSSCKGYYEGINNAEYALHVHVLTYILSFSDLG
jgi:hypothetical protein